MLGSQSWYTALAVPTIVIGAFVATRKRLAYQWREELMDPEGTVYPTVTDADMEYFRRVAPATAVEAAETLAAGGRNHSPLRTTAAAPAAAAASSSSLSSLAASAEDASGVPLTTQDNIGLNVRSDALPPELRNVLLNEVQRWSQQLGNPLDHRKVDAIERHLHATIADDVALQDGNGSSSSFSSSFAHEVEQRSTAGAAGVSGAAAKSWLSVDFLRSTRVIADHPEDIQAMKAPWGCGDHMRLEQMPAALRYLVCHTQRVFEGMGRLRHVYIEYSPSGEFYRAPRPPKMYDGHDYVIIPLRRDGRDTVVTMSPVLRSRVSDLREVALHSWTTRDVDALVPGGCMLRVYGTARYEWGWGMRPGPAWFGSRLNRIVPPLMAEATSSAPDEAASWRLLRQLPWWTKSPAPLWRRVGLWKEANVAVPASSAPKDAALIVLHYEGPRSNNKQRSLLLQPEIWIFGRPPSVETYETWYEDRPTAESVKEEGVVRFMIRNYFDMLTVS
ncbi:hypothetical protein NQL31_007978 [Lotmaria passim]